MTAKSYLQQIKKCDIKINNVTEELEQLEALATKVTSVVSGDVVSRTRKNDTMTDYVVEIIKLKADLDAEINRYVSLKREVMHLLSNLENPIYYQVLHSRYILYKTWEQIACDMDFTYQWVCELHGRALQEFAKIMEKSFAT